MVVKELKKQHLSFYQNQQEVVGQQELEKNLMTRQEQVVAAVEVLMMKLQDLPLAWNEEEVVEVEEVKI